MEVKYEMLPHLCYGCGMIPHETRNCELAKGQCFGFGDKNALYGEWVHSEMNMVVPSHMKDGKLNKHGINSVSKGQGGQANTLFAFNVESSNKGLVDCTNKDEAHRQANLMLHVEGNRLVGQ